jgi:hypothetical protein
MVSVPVFPIDPDALVILGFATYDTTMVRIKRWDSTLVVSPVETGDYREYDDGLSPASFLDFVPGHGLWVLTSQAQAGTLFQVTGSPVDTSQDFVITTQQDWNQIGAPFPFAVCKSALSVRKNGVTFPFSSQDPSDPWIEDQILAYRADYVDSDRLSPFEGYFVNNISIDRQPVDILVRPELCLAQASVPQGEAEDSGWRMRIAVTSNARRDAYNYLGLAPFADEGYDTHDLQEPPAIASGTISLYFPHDDWEDFPGNYRTDIRSLSSRKETFRLTVDTKRKVSLSKITWENVPEDYTVTLTDLKTGRKVDMNRKDVYFFITIFDPLRDFEVEVVRR